MKEQRWCPTWLQRVIITCSEGLQDQVFRETFKITQPFTCYVGFTGLQRPSLVIDFSMSQNLKAEIPWSLISKETDGALRQSEEGFWRGAPDATLQASSSFPWGAPWSRSYLWAPRESRLRYLVISSLHKFMTWSQETENRTSTMCDRALCLRAQGRDRYPLGISKCLWIKSDCLNARLRAKALTFSFKRSRKHKAYSADVFVNSCSKNLLRWLLCFSV